MNKVNNKVVLFDAPNDIDKKVVFLARVSSENQDNPKYERLIKYLLKEGHFSPFDMVNMTFEINTEKDVGIQLLRHQTLKPQEWSQRYADCSDMKAPLRECRIQDVNNRQNSIVTHDIELIDWWLNTQKEVQDLTFKRYQEALEKGIAKELARSILTIGLTSTKMYFNASLRSWLFYCLSRTHVSTQKEHRIVAKEILTVLLDIAPCATNAFIKLFMLNKKEQYDFDFNLLTKEHYEARN